MQPNKAKGYTLIELLVVIFIIGIVTGVALLSLGRHQQKTAFFVDELVEALRYSEEQALFHTKPMGLMLNEHAYQFAAWQDTQTQTHAPAWVLSRDPQLRAHAIPDELQVAVKRRGVTVDLHRELKAHPIITFSEDGEMTPFVIEVDNQQEKVHYVITGEANGEIESHRAYLD
jgi:general secretion pathway protein H